MQLVVQDSNINSQVSEHKKTDQDRFMFQAAVECVEFGTPVSIDRHETIPFFNNSYFPVKDESLSFLPDIINTLNHRDDSFCIGVIYECSTKDKI